MKQLHYLLTLQHPRRFWWSAVAIAIISTIVLRPWIDSTPWLVAIPLVAGGLLVALGELWEELGGKRLSPDSKDNRSSCRHL